MLWINAPHFCAGIEPQLRAAPILQWMIREHFSELQIRKHCARVGWRVESVEPIVSAFFGKELPK